MSMLVEAVGLAIPGRLEDTSLSLRSGEVACLIGPNGSGKTSLLHALAGIAPARGSVLIAGEDPARLHPDRRQRLLSFLPASRDVKWPVIGRDLIGLGLPAALDRSLVDGLVAELDLAHLLDRRVDRLSTGERSRILIARALAAAPRLLLLDEPTANLDPLWQLRLMDYLRKTARREQGSVLLAVHDLETARHFADRLIVMDRGRLAADGDPQRLLSGPLMRDVFGIRLAGERWEAAD